MKSLASDATLQEKIQQNLALIAAFTESLTASIFPPSQEDQHAIAIVPTTQRPNISVTESPTALVSPNSDGGPLAGGTLSTTQALEPVIIETHFDFLRLPLELWQMIYSYVYVPEGRQLQPPCYVLGKLPPHFSCNIHLLCRSIFQEIIAFVRSHAIWAFHLTFRINPPRDYFEGGVVGKALKFPRGTFIAEFRLMIYDPFRLTELAETIMMCVYYVHKYEKSDRAVHITIETFRHEYFIIGEDGRTTSIREGFSWLQIHRSKVIVDKSGNLLKSIEDRLQQALDELQGYRDSNTSS